jgi:hypothetical protein
VHPPGPCCSPLFSASFRFRHVPPIIVAANLLLLTPAVASHVLFGRTRVRVMHRVSSDTAVNACLLPTFSSIPPRLSTLTHKCICHVLPGRLLRTASCSARAPATNLHLLRLKEEVQMVQKCRFISRLPLHPRPHSLPSLLQRLLTWP